MDGFPHFPKRALAERRRYQIVLLLYVARVGDDVVVFLWRETRGGRLETCCLVVSIAVSLALPVPAGPAIVLLLFFVVVFS